jgi:ketosteroid isomerase-like protein
MTRDAARGPAISLERMRAGFEAFNSGDPQDWMELFCEDVELREIAEMPDAAVYHGHEGVRRWFAGVTASMGDFRFRPGSAWWGEGTNVVEVHGSAVGTGSGVPIEWTVYVVSWLRGDRIARTQGFLDRDEAMAAAGPVVPY